MHYAARIGIEGIAPVQGAAVIPDHEIADFPLLAECESRLRRMRPERIEQRLAFLELEPHDVAVAPPAEEQALAPGFRMRAHQPMVCAGSAARIRQLLAAKADHEVVEPGFADGGERIRGDRPGHVDAAHFSAQRFADSIYGDRGHGVLRGREILQAHWRYTGPHESRPIVSCRLDARR